MDAVVTKEGHKSVEGANPFRENAKSSLRRVTGLAGRHVQSRFHLTIADEHHELTSLVDLEVGSAAGIAGFRGPRLGKLLPTLRVHTASEFQSVGLLEGHNHVAGSFGELRRKARRQKP